jgi:translation initiation factor 1
MLEKSFPRRSDSFVSPYPDLRRKPAARERFMAKREKKTVLFLCAGTDPRGRVAEILFDSVAGKIGMPWKASSRSLAPAQSAKPFASATSVGKALESRGVRGGAEVARPAEPATLADLEGADWIVALDEAEHLPQVESCFPGWADKVESWQVKDALVVETIEREVIDLTARLIGGGRKRQPVAPEAVAEAPAPQEKEMKTAAVVRVGRETKGRRGKGVTTVSDVPLDESGLMELAARLKQRCGTGGTVKEGRIEIQGDQRDRLAAELEALGYRVKRVGG